MKYYTHPHKKYWWVELLEKKIVGNFNTFEKWCPLALVDSVYNLSLSSFFKNDTQLIYLSMAGSIPPAVNLLAHPTKSLLFVDSGNCLIKFKTAFLATIGILSPGTIKSKTDVYLREHLGMLDLEEYEIERKLKNGAMKN